MKATLTFNLDDPDDRMAHLRAVKSMDMALALWQLFHNSNTNVLRNHHSLYKQEPSEEIVEFNELWLNEIKDVLEEHGIRVDELIN
jgi:hypothetical protein